jgi:hypothetical protein
MTSAVWQTLLRSVADRTLIISVAGVVMSGIVGPTLTAWAARVSQRKQFLRDREGTRRDELLALCDEAAALLAVGPARIREILDHVAQNRPAAEHTETWSDDVYAIEQRLVLRLGSRDPIVEAYAAVRASLAETLEISVDTDDQQRRENAVLRFESARAAFFETTKRAMHAPVTEKERLQELHR